MRGLPAHQGRLVGGRHHHHRAGEAGVAEVVLQEFLHLAAAFADQPDHRDIGLHVARQHRQQHRFADAGAGENAHALAAAAGQEGVERPHAEIERRADPAARMRQRRRIAEGIRRRPEQQRPLAVDRLAERIDHPAEPAGRRPHRAGNRRDQRPAAAPHAFERRKRHQQRVIAGEADHLAGNILGLCLDHHPGADRHGVQRAGNLDHQAANADHAAIDFDAVELVDLFGQRLHGRPRDLKTAIMVTRKAAVLTVYLPGPLIIQLSSLGTRRLTGQDGG